MSYYNLRETASRIEQVRALLRANRWTQLWSITTRSTSPTAGT